ncbi:hypothetical protein MBLNU13_g07930t1 [Cladosporium sp. NU13]
MAIRYLILLSRQGKVRLAKWFTTLSPKDKAKIIKDVSQLVLARRTRMCNFLEYKDTKVVYRRYASLFFIAATDNTDNELITLEIVHRYVEQMDKYYGNVCELDIIFNFQKAYFILDELLIAGEMQESSKKNVLRVIGAQDSLEDMEGFELLNLGTFGNQQQANVLKLDDDRFSTEAEPRYLSTACFNRGIMIHASPPTRDLWNDDLGFQAIAPSAKADVSVAAATSYRASSDQRLHSPYHPPQHPPKPTNFPESTSTMSSCIRRAF